MPKLSFKEYRAQYRKEHATFNLKEFNAAWKEYKTLPEPEAPPKFETPDLKVEPQPEESSVQQLPAQQEVVQVEQLEPPAEQTSLQELLEDEPPENEMHGAFTVDAEYNMLSEGVHGLAAGFIEDYTEGRVKIEDKKLEKLNQMGALLLKKHDKDRVIAKHGIEFTYCVAIMNIVREIRRDIRQRQRAEEKAKGAQIIETVRAENAAIQR